MGFAVNPRPREGGDVAPRWCAAPFRCFNPRPREGGDGLAARDAWFQSAPPRRGRPGRRSICSPPSSFNPRPREGGDDPRPNHPADVSIRAPAKGATRESGSLGDRGSVSIRAPAKGATGREAARLVLRSVSIRAPAKGATDGGGKALNRSTFQSAPPRRGRLRHDICLIKSEKLSLPCETGCSTTKTTRQRTYASTIN